MNPGENSHSTLAARAFQYIQSPARTETLACKLNPSSPADVKAAASADCAECRKARLRDGIVVGEMKTDTTGTPDQFPELADMADEVGFRLEVTRGITTWEASPGPRHQKAVVRALLSLEVSAGSDCGCFQLPDVYIKFPDGSFKRPDIAVFCEEPPDTDAALQMIPAAVIRFSVRTTKRRTRRLERPSTWNRA